MVLTILNGRLIGAGSPENLAHPSEYYYPRLSLWGNLLLTGLTVILPDVSSVPAEFEKTHLYCPAISMVMLKQIQLVQPVQSGRDNWQRGL